MVLMAILASSPSTLPKKASKSDQSCGMSAPALAVSSMVKPSLIIPQPLAFKASPYLHGANSLQNIKNLKNIAVSIEFLIRFKLWMKQINLQPECISVLGPQVRLQPGDRPLTTAPESFSAAPVCASCHIWQPLGCLPLPTGPDQVLIQAVKLQNKENIKIW